MSFPYLSDLVKALTGYDLPLPLPMFGLCVAAAMLVAASFLKRELGRLHAIGKIGVAQVRGVATPPQEIVPDFIAVVMLAGIFGARLFHILEHTDMFLAHPWKMIFTTSGLSIFGGLIFGTLAGVISVIRWKLPIRPMLDAAAPAMMLGYALGRVGCQISGDGDWGIAANMALKPTWLPSWFWAQTYDNNIYGAVIPAPGVYPTSIYETVMALACFGLLWALRKHPFQLGWLFSVYLFLAGLERLVIEQIRVNPMLEFGGIYATQAEFISVGLMILGLLGVALLSKRLPIDALSAGKAKIT
ncbi:prolipoprotein diacylglyceryl transferase [Solimicrobium silvestre]|uniref:Prolipoprotein diacylglyceryltransferase n=1 Tax=Solimicrobium silvestre TaxID=2099400 RepID=A0A2S9GSR0_9BURK|nr:prolipoprotein diacylglyceryl transferase [Solimicrobium silvestre]PRC90759.1 Prolipoprotein diacylglyceryltransferase [Solimicrobium silvestre]